jgi:hypothetical protein
VLTLANADRGRRVDAEVLVMSDLDLTTIDGYVTELLTEFCGLGRNSVVAWKPSASGIELIIAPKFLILANAHKNDRIVVGQRRIEGPDFDALLEILDARPIELDIGNLAELPGDHQVLRRIEKLVRKHSIVQTPQRAAALFDIVNFSLLSAVEQVAQLNSLEYSISAARKRVADLRVNLDIARSNTGDGFYIWNHDNGLAADLGLYYVTILALCENALEREKGALGLAPVVRSCIHLGAHYSYHQMGQLTPTDHDYIVGELTITLARMCEVELPGQILLGDFVRQPDDGHERPIDTPKFVSEGARFFERLNGANLGGMKVGQIKTYLTGEQLDDDKFYIDKLNFKDKHDKLVSVFNAKANLYRLDGEPIFLGLQHAKLKSKFTIEHMGNMIRA